MSIFLIFLSTPFFFFLPGYLLTLFLPWVRGFSLRLGIAVATSVALGVLVSIVLGKFLFWALTIGVLVGSFVWRERTKIILKEWQEATRKERIFVISIFLLSVLAAVFIAVPHFDYPWPIHPDEWWAVGTVQNVIEGKPLNNHPYFFTEFPNYKPGFTSYLAALFGFFGQDPAKSWAYLPAINAFLVSFVMGCLLFTRVKSFFILTTPIFLISLRSNTYTLGWWFFTPFAFSFLFVVTILLLATEWFHSWMGKGWAVIIFLALALIYPPSAVLCLLVLLPTIWREISWRQRIFFVVLVVGAIAVAVGADANPYRSLWQIQGAPVFAMPLKTFIESLFIPLVNVFRFHSWGTFLEVMSIPFLLLLLVGLWRVYSMRWVRALLFGLIFNFLIFVVGGLFGFSFLVFPQRALYFLGIVAVPFVVLGFQHLLLWFARNSLPSVSIVVGIVIISLTFYGYFQPLLGSGDRALYWLVERKDLPAFAWLREQDEFRGMAVLTEAPLGTVFTPLTRLPAKVSLLTLYNINLTRINDFVSITDKSCGELKELMNRLGTQLFYASKPKNCPFFEEIFHSMGVFIYRYRVPRQNVL